MSEKMTQNEAAQILEAFKAGLNGEPFPEHPSWSLRIPAAIAKAEELLASTGIGVYFKMSATGVITATEVALAKALWEAHQSLALEYGERVEIVPPALRDFCTKVESLD